ncbi:MAG: SDR family NAD(P)-dependent oxidoreductase [Bacteroidota bacterium]
MEKIALVTGATSGIGKATATLLLENGYKVIVCGRRADRLEEIRKKYPNTALPLSFDITEKSEVFDAIASLNDDWRDIGVLINNAGNAHGLSTIDEGDVEDWDKMIDINVKGLLYVSKAIIPKMVDRKSGHIINIGSIAGKEVYPRGNVYCASKHAVDAINSGMRMDLFEHGIKVTAINPGLVETEFSNVRFKGDDDRAKQVYDGFDPLLGKDIAETILFVLSRPEHVNIADLTIFPKAQAASTLVNRGA